MEVSAIILSACLHKDIAKQSLCVDTATKCIGRDANSNLEECLEEGRLKIKKSCYEDLSTRLNTPDNEILYYVSKCNDLILDRLMNIKKNYYKTSGEKMSLEESTEREWLAALCQKISRALTLYCKENTFGKVGHN